MNPTCQKRSGACYPAALMPAAPIKILSDFDGVWTDQGPEAGALVDWTIRTLVELADDIPPEQTREELESLRRQMKRMPSHHGWAPGGRISAFVDEDPLVESSALCRLIDSAPDAVTQRFKASILQAGHASVEDFSQHAFVRATAEFRAAHPPCIIADAARRLAELQATGAEVVIISNSETDKIADWLTKAGVEPAAHNLRIRGNAKKWFLGEGDESIRVADRRIYVDRPRYREAIVAESPDIIIGDVFSLDLALPHSLRTAGLEQAPSRLVLRRHAHTPEWVTKTRAAGAVDHIVSSVGDLAEVVDEMRG